MKKIIYFIIIYNIIITIQEKNYNQVTSNEVEIRKELQIPLEAKWVLLLSNAAHLDWDWLNWFSTNVRNVPEDEISYWNDNPLKNPQFTNRIFTYATELLSNYSNYYYSICEMAFLKEFSKDYPFLFNKMKSQLNHQNKPRLRIVGGGMTSPDNLLPHGECIIRNYLVGITWLNSVNISWSNQVWVPDDFGHDSQFPAILKAMGVEGVGFARIPGACDQGPTLQSINMAEHLLNRTYGGVDFIWSASDGSKITAHWLEAHYDQGSTIYEKDKLVFGTPEQVKLCKADFFAKDPIDFIFAYFGANQPVSPTPYIYVHVSSDFAMPKLLVDAASQWNNIIYNKTGIYVAVATFDHYIKLVNSYSKEHPKALKVRSFYGVSPTTKFQSTPYWMGFYASRPQLKILHNAITRYLISAEIFSFISIHIFQLKNFKQFQIIDNLWTYFVPSTHHDFVTGTSTDYVYNGQNSGIRGEQLVRLENCFLQSIYIRDLSIMNIASNIKISEPSIAVFNSLGYDNKGLIEVNGHINKEIEKFGQKIKNGKTLFYVNAPSLGYNTLTKNSLESLFKEVSLQKAINYEDESLILENKFLRVTISKHSNWGIEFLIDKNLNINIISNYGNNIQIFYDGGNLYRFGFENRDCQFCFIESEITPLDAKIVENGPLRQKIIANVQYSYNSWLCNTWEIYKFKQNFTLEYSLHADEPFLRIKTTGASPIYSTVMTKFNFFKPIKSFEHGTPYHWVKKVPEKYQSKEFESAFEATHDFIIAYDENSKPLGAIYHTGGSPAWTINNDGDLLGVLFRNTPGTGCVGAGAEGHDNDIHIQEYALRIPSGIQSASTGLQLREAKKFNTPMIGFYLNINHTGNLPTSFSLASIINSNETIITTAKKKTLSNSDLILRIYQPTNKPLISLKLLINGIQNSQYIKYVTALEEENISYSPIKIDKKDKLSLQAIFDAPYSLTTLLIDVK